MFIYLPAGIEACGTGGEERGAKGRGSVVRETRGSATGEGVVRLGFFERLRTGFGGLWVR